MSEEMADIVSEDFILFVSVCGHIALMVLIWINVVYLYNSLTKSEKSFTKPISNKITNINNVLNMLSNEQISYQFHHTNYVYSVFNRFDSSQLWYVIEFAYILGGNLDDFTYETIEGFIEMWMTNYAKVCKQVKVKYNPKNPNKLNTLHYVSYLMPIPYINWKKYDKPNTNTIDELELVTVQQNNTFDNLIDNLDAHFIKPTDAPKFAKYIMNMTFTPHKISDLSDRDVACMVKSICDICVQMRQSEQIPSEVRKLIESKDFTFATIGRFLRGWINTKK